MANSLRTSAIITHFFLFPLTSAATAQEEICSPLQIEMAERRAEPIVIFENDISLTDAIISIYGCTPNISSDFFASSNIEVSVTDERDVAHVGRLTGLAVDRLSGEPVYTAEIEGYGPLFANSVVIEPTQLSAWESLEEMVLQPGPQLPPQSDERYFPITPQDLLRPEYSNSEITAAALLSSLGRTAKIWITVDSEPSSAEIFHKDKIIGLTKQKMLVEESALKEISLRLSGFENCKLNEFTFSRNPRTREGSFYCKLSKPLKQKD
ncbi:hypothetical protein [Pseudooceanicola atlanticus]|uniref:hypothetical protein n=1 Tax=Pseudooceanicola atlanticus TaxID=1461694 RepID=UPI0012E009EB|nr:hypothetical protein [Pseudooceanicola atlanticus]